MGVHVQLSVHVNVCLCAFFWLGGFLGKYVIVWVFRGIIYKSIGNGAGGWRLGKMLWKLVINFRSHQRTFMEYILFILDWNKMAVLMECFSSIAMLWVCMRTNFLHTFNHKECMILIQPVACTWLILVCCVLRHISDLIWALNPALMNGKYMLSCEHPCKPLSLQPY